MLPFYWIVLVLAVLVYIGITSLVLLMGSASPAIDRKKAWPPLRNPCPDGWTLSDGYCSLKLARATPTSNQLSIAPAAKGLMTTVSGSGAQFTVPRGGPAWKASKATASATKFQENNSVSVQTSLLGGSVDGSATPFVTGDTGWWIAFQPSDPNGQNDWWKTVGLTWS
jgi:hypothetical protein